MTDAESVVDVVTVVDPVYFPKSFYWIHSSCQFGDADGSGEGRIERPVGKKSESSDPVRSCCCFLHRADEVDGKSLMDHRNREGPYTRDSDDSLTEDIRSSHADANVAAQWFLLFR